MSDMPIQSRLQLKPSEDRCCRMPRRRLVGEFIGTDREWKARASGQLMPACRRFHAPDRRKTSLLGAAVFAIAAGIGSMAWATLRREAWEAQDLSGRTTRVTVGSGILGEQVHWH